MTFHSLRRAAAVLPLCVLSMCPLHASAQDEGPRERRTAPPAPTAPPARTTPTAPADVPPPRPRPAPPPAVRAAPPELLNACVMWTDGEDASELASHLKDPVYASVRGIVSEGEAEGCDAIVRLGFVQSFFGGQAKADILSGISQKVLYRSPTHRWDSIPGYMALQLGPGGESYNAIMAEKTADCSAGSPRDAPFCAKVLAQAREKEAAAIRAVAAQEARKEAAVREKIPAWRALAAKPPLPEGARKYRVLAEDAVGEKRFEDAVNYYEGGLAVEPLWPEGHFNAAILYGELQKYAQAASHMRLYLELVPDAKNAASARNKIIIWEEKAGHPG